MAFTNTRGRYATFGVASSLPSEVIDTFWYIIDNNLKGVFKLNPVLKFQLLNKNGKLTYQFSEDNLITIIQFDFAYPFDPFFPKDVLVVDNDGNETVILPDEYYIF